MSLINITAIGTILLKLSLFPHKQAEAIIGPFFDATGSPCSASWFLTRRSNLCAPISGPDFSAITCITLKGYMPESVPARTGGYCWSDFQNELWFGR